MKGILLAGGTGTRMMPCTKVTNKHLLPVYDRPMIYHPLNTLIRAGMKDILVVSGPGHAGHFLNLLGSGKDFGVKLIYEIQDEAGGIAQALGLAEDFADEEDICVILGDNIFVDDFSGDIRSFRKGARIFLKAVPDAERFGVAEVKGDRVVGIEEKPKKPKSDLAVTGLYVYDNRVFSIIRNLKPSHRGELEITDVNNRYIGWGDMSYAVVESFWSDAGTFDSLLRASNKLKEIGGTHEYRNNETKRQSTPAHAGEAKSGNRQSI
jgi:glucose-1-phosphate thymidylyltransferase